MARPLARLLAGLQTNHTDERQMQKTLPLVTAAALAFASSMASAAVIVAPTSVSSPQGEFPGFPLVNIVNQSGLSAAYTSGVTDFGAFTSTATHDGLSGTGFTGAMTNGPQQFTFDLGSVLNIDAIAIWNTSSAGAIARFQVFFDNDADFGNGTSGTLVGASAIGAAGPAQVFGFASTATRYVHLEGLATLAPPDFYGLGEVAFSSSAAAVPAPAPLALLGLGLAGLAATRKRRT